MIRCKAAWPLLLAGLLIGLVSPARAALPTVRGTGGVKSGTGTISPAMPTGVLQNDVLLLILETFDEVITVSGGTETWAEVADSPQSVASVTRLTVFWARASQDTPTSPTTSDSGDHQIGHIIAFVGVIQSGDPWDVTSGGTEAVEDTTVSITGDSTTVVDCLVAAILATDLPDANDSTSVSGEANGDLGSLTEQIDNARNSGNGGLVYLATGTKAAVGSYGATTATLEDAAQKAFMTVALKPPVAGGVRRVLVMSAE